MNRELNQEVIRKILERKGSYFRVKDVVPDGFSCHQVTKVIGLLVENNLISPRSFIRCTRYHKEPLLYELFCPEKIK